MTIRSRPATREYRENFDRAFGRRPGEKVLPDPRERLREAARLSAEEAPEQVARICRALGVRGIPT
jgi:hypothetical protein